MNDKEVTLNDDGFAPEMYDIGAKLTVKATAEGHADKEKEYVIKDELTDGKNTLDLILPKNKVIIFQRSLNEINFSFSAVQA